MDEEAETMRLPSGISTSLEKSGAAAFLSKRRGWLRDAVLVSFFATGALKDDNEKRLINPSKHGRTNFFTI